MEEKNVTLMDLANRVGVSKVTVSRALNGSGRMSAEVREKIRRLANEMDYRPRLAAKFLRSGRTNQLDLIVTEPREIMSQSGFFGPILAAFVDTCETDWRGYHIEICPREGSAFVPPLNVAGGMVDGVIVAGKPSVALRTWLDETSGVPWVSLDEAAEFCVTQAYDRGVFRAIESLVNAGHRDILFACGQEDYLVNQEALAGYRQAASKFGLSGGNTDRMIQRVALGGGLHAYEFLDWALSILRMKKRPSAVYCNDLRLAHALTYAAAKHGLNVPEELSVIGLGPENYAVAGLPPVTSLQPNFKDAVYAASRMLKQRISGERIANPHCQVDLDFVIRGTTR